MKTFDEASNRFRGQSPDKEIQFICALSKHYMLRKNQMPKTIMSRYNELTKLNATPPPIVLDNLPKQ